jgi:hypothetical protein
MTKSNNGQVSLAVQDFHIKRLFNGFHTRQLKRGYECSWYGSLQPGLDCIAYQIVIHYRLGGTPKVTVKSPEIKDAAPHRYKDKSLCLFKSDEQPWRGSELIAETIIPWTASWLYYYELWLDTDQWYGPEANHTTNATNSQSK